MRIVKALDAGPMLASVALPIGPDETSVEVERALATAGAPLLLATVDQLASGVSREVAQDDALATYAHRITRDEGLIDWTHSAAQIHNQIRGLHPWPHAHTFWAGQRLIIRRSLAGKTRFRGRL